MESSTVESAYCRTRELQAFDDTKEGVKGLVDARITHVPRIFHRPPDEIDDISYAADSKFSFPTIDFEGVHKDLALRKQIVDQVRQASENWGFFNVINHGIPVSILDEMKEGVRRFHEQDSLIKKEFYTRDRTKKVSYNSNFDLYSAPYANWRDSIGFQWAPDPPKPEQLPVACRDIIMEYTKQIGKLGNILFELLSEALGLKPNHLKDIGCEEGLLTACHYYPSCPQPELTFGTSPHSDGVFLTILLQDHIGGLQFLHQNQWIDAPPAPGALVVNIGDLLQLISNDKFMSAAHRVLANRIGPRVSVACFFSTYFRPTTRIYGPIKELISEENPPKYRETTQKEYAALFAAKGLSRSSALQYLRL